MSIAKGAYREYETIYVMRPDAGDDATRALRDRLKAIFDKLGGHVSHWDDWGKRKLAFEIQDRSALKKHNKGYYVYLRYGGKNDLVAEIERNLRNADAVIRFQTIKLDTTVELASVAVNPDEVKFERLAVPTEEEPEPSLEERLGLVVKPRERVEEEFIDDEDGPDLNNIPDLGNTN